MQNRFIGCRVAEKEKASTVTPRSLSPRINFYSSDRLPVCLLPAIFPGWQWLNFFFLLFSSFFFLFITSCGNLKKVPLSDAVVNLDTLVVKASAEPQVYNPSRTIFHDLIHTKLDVRFDWEKQYLYGKATLSFRPYFYPQPTLDLDAKGFNLHRVSLLRGSDTVDLKYSYDSLVIRIFLDREYTRKDTFYIFVDYTAKPNECEAKGSAAITSDKGLYFINADGKDSATPKQVWTQGETEANSCWFPTIDSPNEKMTQEIFITVDKKFLTLSNGVLQYQVENNNDTRTDYWKQDLPHSPYLAMMAIGEYALIKDKWRGIEVNYYVEKEYEKYAGKIFGNTPEMLEFYSEKLGVDYPWEKFSQVVVRDYVSGAMENTSAVIHGEFIQQNDREMLDNDYEDVIAHELFHHWFGDLVTCESWANLPLNESFATLGEYLWIEHKYGREEADYHLQQDFSSYFSEATRKQENLIRFSYSDKEDMFDRHSYQKGGAVLNMLRKYVGDEAFFESLKLYLTKNKFGSAEVHHLRLAFEEVTGEDLNWFFNQWFLSPGHPELIISYKYSDSLSQQKIIVEQKQDLAVTPLYRLPLAVDIYSNGKKERHKIEITKQREEFNFTVSHKPDLVNVDADKILLGDKKDKKEASAWIFQYNHAPLYLDHYEAVIKCAAYSRLDSMAAVVVMNALSDRHWNIRTTAIRSLDFLPSGFAKSSKDKLMDLALKDNKSSVRAEAIRALHKYYKDEEVMNVYKNAMEDLSYSVIGEALASISEDNMEEGMKLAKSLEKESSGLSTGIMSTIAGIYAEKGGDAEREFFEKYISEAKGFGRIGFVVAYEKYLKKETLSDETVSRGIPILKKIIETDNTFYVKLYGIQALKNLEGEYTKREMILNDKIAKLTAQASSNEKEGLQLQLDRVILQKKKLSAVLEELKEVEAGQKMHFNWGN